jgi:hypothetical protein
MVPHQIAGDAQVVQRRGVARIVVQRLEKQHRGRCRVLGQSNASQSNLGADRIPVALQCPVVAVLRLGKAVQLGQGVALHH